MNGGFIAFLETGIMAAFVHATGNACVDKLKLKINLSKGEKRSEKLFTTKIRIQPSQTDLVGRSRLLD
jgi:hypothetical protein